MFPQRRRANLSNLGPSPRFLGLEPLEARNLLSATAESVPAVPAVEGCYCCPGEVGVIITITYDDQGVEHFESVWCQLPGGETIEPFIPIPICGIPPVILPDCDLPPVPDCDLPPVILPDCDLPLPECPPPVVDPPPTIDLPDCELPLPDESLLGTLQDGTIRQLCANFLGVPVKPVSDFSLESQTEADDESDAFDWFAPADQA